MGGHTIAKQGFVIDMRFFNNLTFCPSRFNGEKGQERLKTEIENDPYSVWATEDRLHKSDTNGRCQFICNGDKEPDFHLVDQLLGLDDDSDDWKEDDSIIVQPGATWTQIIFFLNKMGK